MEKPMRPSEATDEPPSASRRVRGPVWLAVVVFLAVLGFAWGVRSYEREHDRHVVLGQVRQLESRIRSHEQPGLWLLVEGNDVPGRPDPLQEERHQAMLRDFERLAHLESFEMTDIEANVQGAEARVSYRIRGVARSGQEPAPAVGEMRFVRQGAGWRLVDHRLMERP
jgi:hypothetical protein